MKTIISGSISKDLKSAIIKTPFSNIQQINSAELLRNKKNLKNVGKILWFFQPPWQVAESSDSVENDISDWTTQHISILELKHAYPDKVILIDLSQISYNEVLMEFEINSIEDFVPQDEKSPSFEYGIIKDSFKLYYSEECHIYDNLVKSSWEKKLFSIKDEVINQEETNKFKELLYLIVRDKMLTVAQKSIEDLESQVYELTRLSKKLTQENESLHKFKLEQTLQINDVQHSPRRNNGNNYIYEDNNKIITELKNNGAALGINIKEQSSYQIELESLRNDNARLQLENNEIFNSLIEMQNDFIDIIIKSNTHIETNTNSKKNVVGNNLFGAGNRIKEQLSYRLGSVMIAKSRSLSGWITMPFALRREIKNHKKMINERSKFPQLPKLADYSDYYEISKVKNHLSYRLGNILIVNSKNLSGILKTPFIISKEVKNFRINKKNKAV